MSYRIDDVSGGFKIFLFIDDVSYYGSKTYKTKAKAEYIAKIICAFAEGSF